MIILRLQFSRVRPATGKPDHLQTLIAGGAAPEQHFPFVYIGGVNAPDGRQC
jgi:hypothetical protein